MSYVNDAGIWECVDTSLSVEGNMVVGSTNHFSVFAITLNPETANDTNNTKKDKDGGGGGGAGAAVGIVSKANSSLRRAVKSADERG